MNNINKICKSDEDCNNNSLCAFNENDFNNYCIENNIEKLYYGCLNPNNNFDAIESKSRNSKQSYMECIDFVRKQTNKDDIDFNYMIYRDKKKVFIDLTTINIYLKCEDEILAVIPYNDYFNLNCDSSQENCVLIGKESLNNFIIQNTKNGKIYLEITFECENEGLKKTEKIPINLNTKQIIKINMNCPINKDDDRYKTKCDALYINNKDDNLKTYIDYNTSLYNCTNPLFKVPKPILDTNKYKKLKNKNNQNELKKYDEKINEKIMDLRKLEAEKYIKIKNIQTGKIISYEDALDAINKYPLQNNVNSWKIYKNLDAAQKLYDYNETNVEILKYYGKVYTIQDAMDAANKNNEIFFVWYHNSYELDNFASKLYFIDIYSIDENILKKDNWVKSDNVSTGIMKIQLEHFDDINYDDIFDNNDNLLDNSIDKLKEMYEKSQSNISCEEDFEHAISDTLNKTGYIYNNLINTLDDKITTMSQAIVINDYQTNINNKILFYITVIIGFMIVILISVIVYYNNLYGGKIKLFSQ